MIDFIEANETYWQQEGYTLDYDNDKLVKVIE